MGFSRGQAAARPAGGQQQGYGGGQQLNQGYYPTPGSSQWGPPAGWSPPRRRLGMQVDGDTPNYYLPGHGPGEGGGGGHGQEGQTPIRNPNPMPAQGPFQPNWAYTGYTPDGTPTYGPSMNQQAPVGDDMAQWPDWLLEGRPGRGLPPRPGAGDTNPFWNGGNAPGGGAGPRPRGGGNTGFVPPWARQGRGGMTALPDDDPDLAKAREKSPWATGHIGPDGKKVFAL